MMAGQPILVASWTMRAPACCRQSRASRERIRIWMAFISWPVRLCSAAACSSSAATSPARGAVKCVAAGKKVTQTLFCSFPLRSLSSLERFRVRHRGGSIAYLSLSPNSWGVYGQSMVIGVVCPMCTLVPTVLPRPSLGAAGEACATRRRNLDECVAEL